MRKLCAWVLLACAVGVAGSSSARAVDRIEEFNKAKRSLLQQLKNKDPDVRVEGLERLQSYPIADTVKLLEAGLADSEDKVHDAALETLFKLSGNLEICDTLLATIRKNINRKGDAGDSATLLAVLFTSKLPSVERETNELLDTLAANKHGVAVAIDLADELARHHTVSDLAPLARLTKTELFTDNFGVRRAVVHALTQIRDKQAVGMLIELMPQVRGEAQADAVEYLADLTGQIFGMEKAAWQRWWADTKDAFVFPTRRLAPPAYRSVGLQTSGSYYGLPMFAERMVFVIDTSGSMQGLRLVAAKRELVKAIASLPAYNHFSVVVFNGTVHVWQKELVPATAEWKQAAISHVNLQEAHSNTASYDALEAAFGFDTEAIYFLSDGAPHGGKIVAPVDIITAITAANKTRRISLYTIGIGAGVPGSVLDTFLKTLAEQNLGLYRRVDN